MSVCLVAIAKNEARFLAEWLAHYFALGMDRIIVFDNESTDGTGLVLANAARRFPVTRIYWPSPEENSPQMSAYNFALEGLVRDFEWVCFFDCDEFLVLREDANLAAFLSRFGDDVGAIAVNWLTFGSSGRIGNNYHSVADTFRHGGIRNWGNNHHIKTIARPRWVKSMGIHDCLLTKGDYVHPCGRRIVMRERRGKTTKIDHSIAQLNHYQIKSKTDYDLKIARGRAGKFANDPSRIRSDAEEFFQLLDRREEEYSEIDATREQRNAVYNQIMGIDAATLRSI